MPASLPTQSRAFEFDVFLSHNVADKDRVRALAERLRGAGLRVWFDEWVIRAGDDIYLAIERGLEMARTLVLCLSPAALSSDWVGLERSAALFRDPSNTDRRFIPLLLADCNLPDTLRRFKYVDFRKETPETIEALLVAVCPAVNAAETVGVIQHTHIAKSSSEEGSPTQEEKHNNDTGGHVKASHDEAQLRAKTAVVRKLVLEALSDDDVNSVCQDYFASVYGEFSAGMTRLQKVGRIIEHCVRRNKLTRLVAIVSKFNPEKYAELAKEFDH